LCAWHVPLASFAPYAPVSRRPTADGERRRAEADLARAMRMALGPAPGVKVRPALVCGLPARVIVDQCADAELLVLGGHHADSPLRQTVGAVAASCLRQAPCPVVIVTVAAASPRHTAASPGRAGSPATEGAPAESGLYGGVSVPAAFGDLGHHSAGQPA